MTRFWINLPDAVKFVINCFKLMIGGETFVPKIPSIKILDLAKAIAPNKKIKIIGIKPGEKLHEIMCPRDSSHLTYEFKNYFLIKPDITFFDSSKNYIDNLSGEKGKLVKPNFEYNSKSNPNFLSVEEIKKNI